MNYEPLVSIVIPTYNRATLLKRAITSIMQQTYRNWEVIIIDDASTDNTKEVVEKVGIQNLSYIHNTENRGTSFSRNVGIKHAKGELIAFLDSDDTWYPYHLEESIQVLQDTNYKICSSLWEESYEGESTYLWDMEWFRQKAVKLKDDLNLDISQRIWKLDSRFYEYILKTGFYCFHVNTLVLYKDILKDTGLFCEEMRMSEDMDFIYRILEKYPLVVINKCHFNYYYGSSNLWAYVEKEQDFDEIAPEYQERTYQNIVNKIMFYEHLYKRIENSSDTVVFEEPEAVREAICSRILYRCLTIMFLYRKRDKKRFQNYKALAEKYAYNSQLKYLIEHYLEDGVRAQYFSLY